MIQRRLNQIVREELLHLSRKYPARFASVEEASACLMGHLTQVAAPSALSEDGSASSGEESDGERERRVAHLRSVYGLNAGDAERVTLLGNELRRQSARLRREHAAAAAAALGGGSGGGGGVGGGGGCSGGSMGSGGGESPGYASPEATGSPLAGEAWGGSSGGGERKRPRRAEASAGASANGGSSSACGADGKGSGSGSGNPAAAGLAGGAAAAAGAGSAGSASCAAPPPLPPLPPPPPRLPLRRPFPGAEAAEMAMLASVERLSEKLRLMRPARERSGGAAGHHHASHHHAHLHHLHHQQHHHHYNGLLGAQQQQQQQQQQQGLGGGGRRGLKRGKLDAMEGEVEVVMDGATDGEDGVSKRFRKQ
jgi:hypothetical protein